jgi:hypothetical protein
MKLKPNFHQSLELLGWHTTIQARFLPFLPPFLALFGLGYGFLQNGLDFIDGNKINPVKMLTSSIAY